MKRRVVITGLGVVSPNGLDLTSFTDALQNGVSGVKFQDRLKELNFSCLIAGRPEMKDSDVEEFEAKYKLRKIVSSGIYYGCKAGMEAWEDAGLDVIEDKKAAPYWDMGAIMGTTINFLESSRLGINLIDEGHVRKVGASILLQTMASGVSAYLGGMIGLGNQITTNSSACCTGTEAIINGYNRIKEGRAKVMLTGSCDSATPYSWGAFDSVRLLNRKYNDNPEGGSRPMSASPAGIVPGGGAGVLILEDLDHALDRNARIYAEILSGDINSGGQRGGGTMTAANYTAVARCFNKALTESGIDKNEIDAISGHLTGTRGDVAEINAWSKVLERKGKDFPQINSLKSLIGHCFAASGSIESVACILQLHHGFLHESKNCQVVHTDILNTIDNSCIPHKSKNLSDLKIMAKSSLGFGDVNSCIIFKKWN